MAKQISDNNLYYVNKSGCWVFCLKSKTNNGYAILKRKMLHDSKKYYWRAHRYFLAKYLNKDIPENLAVDHLCRTRDCINPEHLELVSFSENVRRGRRTKISKEQRAEIFKLRANNLTQKEIGRHFNIGQDEVSRILNNKRLKNYV